MTYIQKLISTILSAAFFALLFGSMIALMNINKEIELKDKLNECQTLLKINQE